MRRALPWLAALAAAAAAPALAGDYVLGIGFTLLAWIALTQSWIVLSGLSGYVSLGHVVFSGLGAYVVAAGWGEAPLAALVLGAGLVAGAFAAAVGFPALRVRGPYFVILTYGLAEFVKYLVINVESALGKFSRLLIGAPSLEALYWGMLGLAAVACALTLAVARSRFGMGLRAIREDEAAALTLGVPVVRYKLAAFVLSAAVPGMVGGLMALRTSYFEPAQAFSPMVSFTIVTMAVIGGADDARGPLAGAILLTLLSELLWASAPNLYMVLLGVLLAAFVLAAPQGIVGLAASRSRRGGRA